MQVLGQRFPNDEGQEGRSRSAEQIGQLGQLPLDEGNSREEANSGLHQSRSKSDDGSFDDRYAHSGLGSVGRHHTSGVEAEQETCKHEVVAKYQCIQCQASIPRFGSVADTGNINTFIKVVYVDESKRNEERPPRPKANPSENLGATNPLSGSLLN